MVQMSHALSLVTLLHRLIAIKFDKTACEAHDLLRQEGWLAMHIQISEGLHSVLIVEDEMIVAMLMEDLVRDLGATEVYLCVDTTSALEVLRTQKIDCAVLDLRVRDGDTGQVADLLADKAVPFLFSSGSDVNAIGTRHAARPLISKPFHDDDFKLIVLDTIRMAQPETPIEGQSMPPEGDAGQRVATSGATD